MSVVVVDTADTFGENIAMMCLYWLVKEISPSKIKTLGLLIHGVIIAFCSRSKINRNSRKHTCQCRSDCVIGRKNVCIFLFFQNVLLFQNVWLKGPMCDIQWHLTAGRCTASNVHALFAWWCRTFIFSCDSHSQNVSTSMGPSDINH